MFRKLFDRFKQPPSTPAERTPTSDLQAVTSGLTKPAIHITVEKSGGRSHFGGSPILPDGAAWPQKNGRPLEFLARISLPELQETLTLDWLPREGSLLFFYDMEEEPWGFAPGDRGGWAVLHVPDAQDDPEGRSRVPFKPMGFRRIESYPSYERDEVVDLSLEDDEDDAYCELMESPFAGLPKHQIAGYPSPIQGDAMELDCQEASSGSSLNHLGVDARKAAIRSAAQHWRLLFQIDSDDDLGFMWGDLGILYFWVEEEASRRGDFSNVWLVLQCT